MLRVIEVPTVTYQTILGVFEAAKGMQITPRNLEDLHMAILDPIHRDWKLGEVVFQYQPIIRVERCPMDPCKVNVTIRDGAEEVQLAPVREPYVNVRFAYDNERREG